MNSTEPAELSPSPAGRNASLRVAALVLIIACLWVVSGIILPSEQTKTNGAELEDKSSLLNVRVETLLSVLRQKTITLYGYTEASRRVDLKAETTGKIIDIPITEGNRVKKGDILLHIEVRDREARLAQAEALLRQKEIDFNAAKKLSAKGLQAETRLAEANAQLEQARATLIQARLDLSNTLLQAPFDGILERINVEIGDLVGPNIRVGHGSDTDGTTLASVVDLSPLYIVGNISEQNIKFIKPGIHADITLASGQKIKATIRYVANVSDSETRTFRVELEAANSDFDILSGITARITIPIRESMAHRIPVSALSIAENGEIGVMVYHPNDNAETGTSIFHKINIFDTDADGLWTTGLPNPLQLITVGQAFLTDGEGVTAQFANSKDDGSKQ